MKPLFIGLVASLALIGAGIFLLDAATITTIEDSASSTLHLER